MQFANMSIENLWSADQWTYIRKNVGEWQGTFIQFSPEAVRVSDIPSVLTLEEDRLGQHMTLVLKRTPQGQSTHIVERELGYPGVAPYICFFPTGAFSQGAMQRRPLSRFGAEFSLLSGHRRMRLVQLYNETANGEHTLDYVTLIPEYRPSTAISSPKATRLDLNTILGTWQGDSLYLPATMDVPQIGTSHWQAHYLDNELVLSSSDTSSKVEDAPQRFILLDQHRWQAVEEPLQLWFLASDVSCTVYPQLPQQYRAQVELCWYLSPRQRQRIVRDYDTAGNWVGTALMLETKL